jgi:hypothetical protein
MAQGITTYARGLELKTLKEITKGDIINLCDLLNAIDEFKDLYTFEPEPICEGGIIYNFKNEKDCNKYKTVRFHSGRLDWPYVNRKELDKWRDSSEIIFDKNIKIRTHLKAFDYAPAFTRDELKIWEECFTLIGFKRIGRFPTKKSLDYYGK